MNVRSSKISIVWNTPWAHIRDAVINECGGDVWNEVRKAIGILAVEVLENLGSVLSTHVMVTIEGDKEDLEWTVAPADE